MDDDVDVIEVTTVPNIPVPDGDWIVIDEDNVSIVKFYFIVKYIYPLFSTNVLCNIHQHCN